MDRVVSRELRIAQQRAQAARQAELRKSPRVDPAATKLLVPVALNHEHDWRLDPATTIRVPGRDLPARRVRCHICGAIGFNMTEGPTSGGDPEDLASWLPVETP